MSAAKRQSLPVGRYVEPVLRLESCAHEGASVTRHQIELLSNLNAHVQRLVGVVVSALWICRTTQSDFVYAYGRKYGVSPAYSSGL